MVVRFLITRSNFSTILIIIILVVTPDGKSTVCQSRVVSQVNVIALFCTRWRFYNQSLTETSPNGKEKKLVYLVKKEPAASQNAIMAVMIPKAPPAVSNLALPV